MADTEKLQLTRLIKDLARSEFIKLESDITALPYDDRYSDTEKENLSRYLNDRKKLCDQLINKPLNITDYASTSSIPQNRE